MMCLFFLFYICLGSSVPLQGSTIQTIFDDYDDNEEEVLMMNHEKDWQSEEIFIQAFFLLLTSV